MRQSLEKLKYYVLSCQMSSMNKDNENEEKSDFQGEDENENDDYEDN